MSWQLHCVKCGEPSTVYQVSINVVTHSGSTEPMIATACMSCINESKEAAEQKLLDAEIKDLLERI